MNIMSGLSDWLSRVMSGKGKSLADYGAPSAPGGSLTDMAAEAYKAIQAPGRVYNEGMTPDEMIKAGNDFALTVGAGGSLAPKPANSLGMFGGPLAKTADLNALKTAQTWAKLGVDKDQIWKATGWGQGKDGLWRFEIDDSTAGFLPGQLEKIKGARASSPMLADDVFSHEDLFAAYPKLRELMVSKEPRNSRSYGTSYGGHVSVKDRGYQDSSSTMLHELQHEIQLLEGFARGADPNTVKNSLYSALMSSGLSSQEATKLAKKLKDKHKAYRHIAGETEARNVQSRWGLDKDSRRATPPWTTEDIPRQSQIPIGFKK
jgi:hypothetical protein